MWNPLADMPGASEVEEVLSSQAISAIFGGSRRTGAWVSPDQIRARAYFGEVKLDFREAILPPSGIVEVYATAVFGGVDVIVPKGADVEVESRAVVFGEVGQRTGWSRFLAFVGHWLTGEQEEPEPEHEGLLFRISGSAVFGEVTVTSK